MRVSHTSRGFEAHGLAARTFTDLCRALVRAGHDPEQAVEAVRDDGITTLQCKRLGDAAQWTISETDRGARWVKWRPSPFSTGAQ